MGIFLNDVVIQSGHTSCWASPFIKFSTAIITVAECAFRTGLIFVSHRVALCSKGHRKNIYIYFFVVVGGEKNELLYGLIQRSNLKKRENTTGGSSQLCQCWAPWPRALFRACVRPTGSERSVQEQDNLTRVTFCAVPRAARQYALKSLTFTDVSNHHPSISYHTNVLSQHTNTNKLTRLFWLWSSVSQISQRSRCPPLVTCVKDIPNSHMLCKHGNAMRSLEYDSFFSLRGTFRWSAAAEHDCMKALVWNPQLTSNNARRDCTSVRKACQKKVVFFYNLDKRSWSSTIEGFFFWVEGPKAGRRDQILFLCNAAKCNLFSVGDTSSQAAV